MHTKLRHLWEVISSGYWFMPGLMTLAAAGLAFTMLLVDRAVLQQDSSQSWLYSGGAEGARALLSTIASSIITVAGVVFSITVVALTQASSQFGPRLLRNFMRDTANQVVLGTFVATFVYCLLILRTIRGSDQEGFVPHSATTMGVLLAVIARTSTFCGMVDAAFSQIRQYGRSSPAVIIRMLEVIRATAGQIISPAGRAALLRHAEIIHRDGQEAFPREQDRQDLQQRYEAAVAALTA